VQSGADLILAAGGDGTINEVLNGMVHSGVPLGILPGGTANVLACEIGLGKSMTDAAQKIRSCTPKPVSLGCIRNEAEPQGRHFILMAGAGLDALIVYKIDAKLKAAIGKGAYWLGGFQQFGRPLTEFEVVVDGKSYQCSFALASRVRNYGGDLTIARTANLLGDRFELVLFEGATTYPYLRYFAGVVSGTLSSMRGVHVLQASTIQLKSSTDKRVYIQIDGEHVGGMPACLQIVPHSLQLLIPPTFSC
jgi:diacylglycerol kinase (ATP)